MLPFLVTTGNGLLWLCTTLGQLAIWGFGIGLGYWLVTKVTGAIDFKLASGWAASTKEKLNNLKNRGTKLIPQVE